MPMKKSVKEDKYCYMEDLQVGQKFSSSPPLLITEKSIIEFALQYDPQDFHTDPVKAKDSPFGQLVASGWQTGCLTMRMIVETMPKIKGGMIGRKVERMEFFRPVLPNDKLHIEAEILDLRASGSSPDRGIMRVKNTTFNQKNEPVMEMETIIFIPRRGSTS